MGSHHVWIVGAGLSAEYNIPPLKPAFERLEAWIQETDSTEWQECVQTIAASGESLYTLWRENYDPTLFDLERMYSLAWFQDQIGVSGAVHGPGDVLDLMKPTLWHWYQQIAKGVESDETTGYKRIATAAHRQLTHFPERDTGLDSKHHLVIININWDPILELELLNAGLGIRYDGMPWIPTNPGTGDLFNEEDEPDDNYITVLKPHGSLNWTIGEDGTPDFHHPKSFYYGQCSKGNCTYPEDDILVVPPIPVKLPQAGFGWGAEANEFSRDVWRTVYSALKRSRSITFAGYSFPPSDMLFSAHISSALREVPGPGVPGSRRIRIISPRKPPSRRDEFQNRVFQGLSENTTLWKSTEFEWKRGKNADW